MSLTNSENNTEGFERFRIGGHDVQYVFANIRPGEKVFAETGALLMKDAGVKMDTTIFGGGEKTGLGKFLAPIKRTLTGESASIGVFSNPTENILSAAFSAPHFGAIIPFQVNRDQSYLCQRNGFLCSTDGVSLSPFVAKKLSVGLFSGEGLLLQKIEGEGLAFVHVGGSLITREIKPGETIHIDSGSLALWDGNLDYSVDVIKGAKNIFLGKEGLFLTRLENRTPTPLTAYIQTLPLERLMQRIQAFKIQEGNNKKKNWRR